MHTTKRYELPEGIIYYNDYADKTGRADNGICITAYEGNAEQLLVPECIDNYPVYAVGKKSFLGNRSLRRIVLPDTIEIIGDWAFSRCRILKNITLPKKNICFGTQVFQKSEQLYEINFEGSNEAVSRLLATAVTLLEAEYLLSPLEAGSNNWYQSLDSRILTILSESEDSALKNLVYCAEEDMGAKQEACLRALAHRKVYVAFLRLIYSENITDVTKQTLTDFLLQRTKGCKDESAWEFVKENSYNKLQYCDKLFEINGINEENINDVLDDLGDDNVELKAYLLKKWQGRGQNVDIWESLEF